jgi:hypothetical protein
MMAAIQPMINRPIHRRKLRETQQEQQMIDKAYLLNDKQMRDFIVNGYVIVKTDLPRSFHDEIYKATNTVFEREGNPGNNLSQ